MGHTPVEESVQGLLTTLKNITLETRQSAKDFRNAHLNLVEVGKYYRFNVTHGLENIGLEEYKKEGLMRTATTDYMEEMSGASNRCAEAIAAQLI